MRVPRFLKGLAAFVATYDHTYPIRNLHVEESRHRVCATNGHIAVAATIHDPNDISSNELITPAAPFQVPPGQWTRILALGDATIDPATLTCDDTTIKNAAASTPVDRYPSIDAIHDKLTQPPVLHMKVNPKYLAQLAEFATKCGAEMIELEARTPEDPLLLRFTTYKGGHVKVDVVALLMPMRFR